MPGAQSLLDVPVMQSMDCPAQPAVSRLAARVISATERMDAAPDLGAYGALLFGNAHEHPVVEPHVSHLRHVPLRTRVKLPHSPQASPS